MNVLTELVHADCKRLEQVLTGAEPTGPSAEAILEDFRANRLPGAWHERGWSCAASRHDSSQPPLGTTLGGWLDKVSLALEQLTRWQVECELPKSVHWSLLLCQAGLVTAVRQAAVRRRADPDDPLDGLAVELVPSTTWDHKATVVEPPEEGLFVHGVYVEGARWPRQEELEPKAVRAYLGGVAMFSGGKLEPRLPSELDQLLPMPVLLLRAVAPLPPPRPSPGPGGVGTAGAVVGNGGDSGGGGEGGGGDGGGEVAGAAEAGAGLDAGGAGEATAPDDGPAAPPEPEPVEFNDLPIAWRLRCVVLHYYLQKTPTFPSRPLTSRQNQIHRRRRGRSQSSRPRSAPILTSPRP